MLALTLHSLVQELHAGCVQTYVGSRPASYSLLNGADRKPWKSRGWKSRGCGALLKCTERERYFLFFHSRWPITRRSISKHTRAAIVSLVLAAEGSKIYLFP